MYQLVYISTCSRAFAPGDLEAIFAASRRNNAAAHVTGMLLFNGRRFLQALEGEEAAVRATYDRIHADGRHIALVQLAARTIGAREFGEWAKAQAEGDGGDFLTRVETLTAGAGAVTRAHFRGYAALTAA